MNDDFLFWEIPTLGRRVFRLGLATNFGIEGVDLEWALEQGVNYIFWTPNARRLATSLKAALNRDRESIILASGPTTGFFGGSIKRACDRLLNTLGTEYLDVFQLYDDLLLTHHYLRLALYFLPMLHALARGSPRRQ